MTTLTMSDNTYSQNKIGIAIKKAPILIRWNRYQLKILQNENKHMANGDFDQYSFAPTNSLATYGALQIVLTYLLTFSS